MVLPLKGEKIIYEPVEDLVTEEDFDFNIIMNFKIFELVGKYPMSDSNIQFVIQIFISIQKLKINMGRSIAFKLNCISCGFKETSSE